VNGPTLDNEITALPYEPKDIPHNAGLPSFDNKPEEEKAA
jgi:hypothetical protein